MIKPIVGMQIQKGGLNNTFLIFTDVIRAQHEDP